MTLEEAYQKLKSILGTHRAAAKYLGMAETHYNALRNGRNRVPVWRAEYIVFKTQALVEQEGADKK